MTKQDSFRMLAALHAAMMLKRMPRPGTPDGHGKFFSLANLVQENRVPADADAAELARVARQMTRSGLLVHRRLYGTDYWALTPDGLLELRAETELRGLTDLVDAGQALEQAEYDALRAANAAGKALAYLNEVALKHGVLLPTESALAYAAMHGKAAW
jgi:hypothetical protein